MRYLITGGCGFLGSNLASEVLNRGGELFIFDNLSRKGAIDNLKWLQNQGKFKFYHSDIRSYNDVEIAILDSKPDVIFHLSGQVAMTTSIQNPRLDFEINVLGGHNLLECVRKHCPNSIVTYSSTNKVYGDLEWVGFTESETRYVAEKYSKGFDEKIPLDFQSPYGCSKGAVDQYMIDYAKIFDLNTVVFRHSSIFGGRQFATFDQGWIGWFVQQALKVKNGGTKQLSISGTGKQVRDILFIDDIIKCYFMAIENLVKCRGQAFNVGGGVENSLSLIELFLLLEKELHVKLDYEQKPWRKSDQKVFIADISKATNRFGWSPSMSSVKGVRKMINWIDS